jgi:hypothetical protein
MPNDFTINGMQQDCFAMNCGLRALLAGTLRNLARTTVCSNDATCGVVCADPKVNISVSATVVPSTMRFKETFFHRKLLGTRQHTAVS